MISINLNMSTTLPEAIFILLYAAAKSVHKFIVCDYSFIIKALGVKGLGLIKKL